MFIIKMEHKEAFHVVARDVLIGGFETAWEHFVPTRTTAIDDNLVTRVCQRY
jgi:hypothetical protein